MEPFPLDFLNTIESIFNPFHYLQMIYFRILEKHTISPVVQKTKDCTPAINRSLLLSPTFNFPFLELALPR